MKETAKELLERIKSMEKGESGTFGFREIPSWFGTNQKYWTLQGKGQYAIIYLTERCSDEPNTYQIDDFYALISEGCVIRGEDDHLFLLMDEV